MYIGRLCTVIGCSSSEFLLEELGETICPVHKLRKAGCDCPVPFELFPLPKELVQRKHWAGIINRRDMISSCPKLFCPPVIIGSKERICVCSKHFVEGRPTEFYPFPTL